MDIHISGRDYKVSDKLEDFTHKKLSRIDRYLPNIGEVRVEFASERTRKGDDLATVQITVRHRRGAILRAQESVPGDMQAALNSAIDKLYRQIERFKGKHDRARKGISVDRFIASAEELAASEPLPEFADSPVPEDYEPLIVRRKRLTLTIMSEDEAVEQMELLGHSFFLFQNADSGAVSVVYKRRSGGYGLLMPQ